MLWLKEFCKAILFILVSACLLVALLIGLERYEITELVKEREWMETKATEYKMKTRENEMLLSEVKLESERERLNAWLKYYSEEY